MARLSAISKSGALIHDGGDVSSGRGSMALLVVLQQSLAVDLNQGEDNATQDLLCSLQSQNVGRLPLQPSGELSWHTVWKEVAEWADLLVLFAPLHGVFAQM